jgi:hypothetical protein
MSSSACRSEPGPLSAVVVTGYSRMKKAVDSSNTGSKFATTSTLAYGAVSRKRNSNVWLSPGAMLTGSHAASRSLVTRQPGGTAINCPSTGEGRKSTLSARGPGGSQILLETMMVQVPACPESRAFGCTIRMGLWPKAESDAARHTSIEMTRMAVSGSWYGRRARNVACP